MKKLLILFILLSSCIGFLSAQSDEQPVVAQSTSNAVQFQQEFQAYRNGFFLLFDQGVTAAWNTRIVKQTGRSNFVFEDFLIIKFFLQK